MTIRHKGITNITIIIDINGCDDRELCSNHLFGNSVWALMFFRVCVGLDVGLHFLGNRVGLDVFFEIGLLSF
jgi:hypothetical protein